MDLSTQPAQPPMADAMNTGNAWLNILSTLVPSKHLFATLILQSTVSGYATEERAWPRYPSYEDEKAVIEWC